MKILPENPLEEKKPSLPAIGWRARLLSASNRARSGSIARLQDARVSLERFYETSGLEARVRSVPWSRYRDDVTEGAQQLSKQASGWIWNTTSPVEEERAKRIRQLSPYLAQSIVLEEAGPPN